MSVRFTRRRFNSVLAASAAMAAFPRSLAFAAAPTLRYGYAAITWGDAERQAIDDSSPTGFHGIQLRAPAVGHFTPEELRDLLAQHKLTFVALSSGDLSLDEPEAAQLDHHFANAQFVKAAG